MSLKVQAQVRTRVTVPLRFAGAGRITARPANVGDADVRPLLPDDGGYETVADVYTFTGLADGKEHLALGLGTTENPIPLVRPHSECLTGDVFGSRAATAALSCARRSSASRARAASCSTCARRAAASASTPSSTPTPCRTQGLDTYEANRALGRADDERDYTAAAQMLAALGVDRVRLLTNNPDKAGQLDGAGITVARDDPDRRAPVRRQRALPAREGRPHPAHARPTAGGLSQPDRRHSVPGPGDLARVTGSMLRLPHTCLLAHAGRRYRDRVPMRFIDFSRVFNFRDIGGYATRDGRLVRHNILFRSDNLGSLKEPDREAFAALGLRTIVDLRQPGEIERHGGRAPQWACSVWHNVALTNPAWLDEDYSDEQGPVAYLVERYLEAAKLAGAD